MCKLLKNQAEIEKVMRENNSDCKGQRNGKDNEVESATKMWFTNIGERDGKLLRQTMICQKRRVKKILPVL